MSKRLKTPALILAHILDLVGNTSHNVHISPQPQFCVTTKVPQLVHHHQVHLERNVGYEGIPSHLIIVAYSLIRY